MTLMMSMVRGGNDTLTGLSGDDISGAAKDILTGGDGMDQLLPPMLCLKRLIQLLTSKSELMQWDRRSAWGNRN